MPHQANFQDQITGGVDHPPEADISAIRDLLIGYGSARSILKELVQNAEDAGSKRLDLLQVSGDPEHPVALLRGPGLLAINNGTFRQEHRVAIRQINLGTKSTEQRAIGRYGKGLKSVFAWCEAFFVVARTSSSEEWPTDYITDFFNPWHGWRHGDWTDEANTHGAAIRETIKNTVEAIFPRAGPWLAFWFPLRITTHCRDAEGEVGAIFEEHESPFPGENPKFLDELRHALDKLAPSLVSLRNLESINLSEAHSPQQAILHWKFPEQNMRIPDPGVETEFMEVSGSTVLRDHGTEDTVHQYHGISGTLNHGKVAVLKNAKDWPKAVQRIGGRSRADEKAKGEPHWATLVTAQKLPDAARGSLDLRWCVFFPIGKQPGADGADSKEIPLQNIPLRFTINLHGFFFLDSERLRIDGLEEGFPRNGEQTRKVCIDWNRIVATEGTLPHLPQAVATSAKHHALDAEQCRQLASAIRQTWTWAQFSKDICSQQVWIPCWSGGKEDWQSVSVDKTILPIPRPADAREILAKVPGLETLCRRENCVLCPLDADDQVSGLSINNFHLWPEELVIELLSSVRLGSTGDKALVDWVRSFLSILNQQGALTDPIRHTVRQMPLLTVRNLRTDEERKINGFEWDNGVEGRSLFNAEDSDKHLLQLLSALLPSWTCNVADTTSLSSWYPARPPMRCDINSAAQIIIGQSQLGEFELRLAMASLLANAYLTEDSPILLKAVRYLMHGKAEHIDDTKTILFRPSKLDGQGIWARFVEHLLQYEGGQQNWRVLDPRWAGRLDGNAMSECGITTLDVNGALKELLNGNVDLLDLDFPANEWEDSDLSVLLKDLYDAGQRAGRLSETLRSLRKLRIHCRRGVLDQRISIADENGNLLGDVVLDAHKFSQAIPADLHDDWKAFLSLATIIERRPMGDSAETAQRELFRGNAENGQEQYTELSWPFVMRRCLGAPRPSIFAGLILHALESKGDEAIVGIGPQFRLTPWIPLESGGDVAPQDVISIDGLHQELQLMLDPRRDGMVGELNLAKWVVDRLAQYRQERRQTLQRHFARLKDALEKLRNWVSNNPSWHLGIVQGNLPNDVGAFLDTIVTAPNLPGATLLQKMWHLPSQAENKEWHKDLGESVMSGSLQPFDYNQGGQEKLKAILQIMANNQGREVFDAYLRQAVSDGLIEALLPALNLMNQVGQWTSAHLLIWPSFNIEKGVQLCAEQAAILRPALLEGEQLDAQDVDLVQPANGANNYSLDQFPDFDAEAEKLGAFLDPFRKSQIGDNLPAALVSILGIPMRKLLNTLVQTDLRMSPDDLNALLLGDRYDELKQAIDREKFLIEIIRGEVTKANTLTGEAIEVNLTSSLDTLIVGDPTDIWPRYQFNGQRESACHRLRLREVSSPDEMGKDPLLIFVETIQTILWKAHCNGLKELLPSDLKGALERISKSGQTDLERSQLYLMDMAETRLNELGVKNLTELNSVLQQFEQARQLRVSAELIGQRNSGKASQHRQEADQLTREARITLQKLLESREHYSIQHDLVAAVRRKMENFQYDIHSILMELFQNADDAVVEWAEMRGDLDPAEKQFVVEWSATDERLRIGHWGRPINCVSGGRMVEEFGRGYDQDLLKMLTLNFSDKGSGNLDKAPSVTGRFGLGFKSVFFACDRPEAISGRLAFAISGGFFPTRLQPETTSQLHQWAESYGVPDKRPTVFQLHISRAELQAAISDSVDSLNDHAALLLCFARGIRKIVISGSDSKRTFCLREETLRQSRVLSVVRADGSDFLCFKSPIHNETAPARILFGLNSRGILDLPEQLPRLWITTPTTEKSAFGWALNAPFKPDAGRQQLARGNPDNKRIADEVAIGWANALIQLFDDGVADWATLSTKLGLSSELTAAEFWSGFWDRVTSSSPYLKWDSMQQGGDVLAYIAWGNSAGALRRFVRERDMIPTKLPGSYALNVKVGSIRYFTSGIFNPIASHEQEKCFKEISCWDSFKLAYPCGSIISQSVSTFLQKADCLDQPLREVSLQDVIRTELGPNQQVEFDSADRIGHLFETCADLFKGDSSHGPEIIKFLDSLRQVVFLAADGTYHNAGQLVCATRFGDIIDEDEVLRAAFAPEGVILHSSYSANGQFFFVKARGKLSASAGQMADWVRNAPDKKLPAVFRYLINGELGQQLADQLKRTWLDAQRDKEVYRNLPDSEKSELERLFFKGQIWVWPVIDESPSPPIQPVLPPEDAFRLVFNWWNEEQVEYVRLYEEKTYPPGFPGVLPWPGEDAWEDGSFPTPQARWLMLFIQAALVPLGLNRIGRDGGFAGFLMAHHWLDALSQVESNPGLLLQALDDYLNNAVHRTEYHFQMRQLIAFYAVARNLESVLYALREAERSQDQGAFEQAFRPRTNPNLRGTGIDAPPLDGFLGMGTCQVLRELYRLKCLSNPAGHRHAFTPIWKVRKLCAQLFDSPLDTVGAGASPLIFMKLEALGRSTGLDATFSRCFDLPFQFLAEQPLLRERVLGQEIPEFEPDSRDPDAEEWEKSQIPQL